MNFREAKEMVRELVVLGCGSNPLAAYDGEKSNHLYGDSKKAPIDTDPAAVMCRQKGLTP